MAEDGGAATIIGRNEHEEREDERETPKEKKEMSPWEQHSAVIKLPRFDYNAPSTLLHGSHSGFLITCTIKREKSATKEAISILHKFARPFSKGSYNILNDLKDDNASKKTRVCTEDDAGECLDNKVKETASATAHSGDAGAIAFSQATCGLNEKELEEVLSMLVKKFVDDKQNILDRPVKFAVGYNRRGIEEELKRRINRVVGDSVVDLRTPELCVLVEVLPISGVPNGSIVVAVSVLPRNLVSTKPRLCVRALNSNTKEGCMAE
ncbi:uncharacterized protein DS421_9g281850 [Arachis hypogaea]|nr:uncharacterized protein DS421_9g281850 [Arachis hypogaea]